MWNENHFKLILLLLFLTLFVSFNSSDTAYGAELSDLSNTDLQAPDSVYVGQTMQVNITNWNYGAATGDDADYNNTLYLSQDTLIDDSDQILYNNRQMVSREPDTSLNLSIPVLIPAGTAAGYYNLIFKTDSSNELSESDEENNLLSKGILIESDTAAPIITAIDPANGAFNLASTKVIKVTCSENIKAGNMWIELVHSNGAKIPYTTSINGNILTITPTNPLPQSKYTLIIHTGTVTDLSGNPTALSVSTFTVSVYKIDIIYYGTGGDIRKNKLVYKNLPKTTLTYQVLAAAKKGTPMVTFGDGSGPKVMIVAGVHGNELPAVIAAMRLINGLSKTSVKGTIYVVPLAIPSSIAKKTRYWKGINPNSVAHKAGTPTNKIITLARQLNVNALGDFHSTRPGGVPGKTSILCTKYPTYESYNMALSISRQTGNSLIYQYRAGASYPGAVEDVCNLAGIPAVTCEVKSTHGIVASGSITSSYNQMIAFLRYKALL
jgi:predicted deacylase